jgi:O-succinylbenzoic acid--CoA ligase
MRLVPELVALDLPVGPAFIDHVRRAWERGDAVAPLDQRLPDDARRRTLEILRPTRIVSVDGSTTGFDGVPAEPGDALVIATSGSSGVPKAVVHTHDSIAAAVRASNSRLGFNGTESWLLCIPVAHVGGFLVLARHLVASTPLTIHDHFEAADVMRAARSGATHVSLVATALRRIDPSLFTRILLGGAAAPPSIPDNVTVTYGMTETMGGFAYDGRALDDVSVTVRDGEILVKGPMLMRAYRDGSAATTPDGWFPTGDLGALLDDGRLHVHGRRGDLIITGAEKVWPATVERVLEAHPAVRECVVRGVDDPEWGQRVVAWIAPVGEAPSLETLRGYVKESLPAYCAPRELRIVDALPRTSLGKIDVAALPESV